MEWSKVNEVLSVTGAMVSSGCCLVQLALNAMSLGCAGFGILTPYKKVFLGLTFGSLMIQWRFAGLRKKKKRRLILMTMIVIFVAFSSELLEIYNNNRFHLNSINQNGNHHDNIIQTIQIQISGVKCTGCKTRGLRVLDSIPWVESHNIIPENQDYSNSVATVQVSVYRDQLPPNLIPQKEIISALKSARFEII